MQRIKDYSFLFQKMTSDSLNNKINDIQVSQIGSQSVQARLKAAGINTNSAQYKAAIRTMTQHPGSSGMYTNVQAIKNLMNTFDKDGDEINPNTGLSGVFVTEETAAKRKRIVSIPESSREEIFKIVKKNFEQYNGMSEAVGKHETYINLQKKMKKNDRLAASYTLSQYEQAYAKAFVKAIKAVDPKWDYGKAIPEGAIDGITRESVEHSMGKSFENVVDIQV